LMVDVPMWVVMMVCSCVIARATMAAGEQESAAPTVKWL
jgi:hypothetical protein